jgi:hypothetical protein
VKILTHERDKVGDFQKRVLLHLPIGITIGMSWLAHWAVTLSLCYLFVAYEENEDVHTKDKAWKDYFGGLAGLVIGGALSIVIKVIYNV